MLPVCSITSICFPSTAHTQARWRLPSTMGGGGSAVPLCPGDCFGRGTCYDPWDLTNMAASGTLPPPLLPVLPSNTGKPADFQCACRGGEPAGQGRACWWWWGGRGSRGGWGFVVPGFSESLE